MNRAAPKRTWKNCLRALRRPPPLRT